MHPALKIAAGALMVIVGVFASLRFWPQFLTLAKAGIGPLLVLIGAFVVWLESDEWKMRRQQSQQESSEGLQQQFEQAQDVVEEESEEEVEGHECAQCGKSFDTERGLHIHQAQKHE